MERRTFVKLSAYTAAALTLPFVQGCAANTREKVIAQPLLFSHITDSGTIISAGQAYRKLFPAEDSKSALIGELVKPGNQAGEKAIEQMLDQQVVNDFKNNKMIVLDGWVLALTEARQCALYAILNS